MKLHQFHYMINTTDLLVTLYLAIDVAVADIYLNTAMLNTEYVLNVMVKVSFWVSNHLLNSFFIEWNEWDSLTTTFLNYRTRHFSRRCFTEQHDYFVLADVYSASKPDSLSAWMDLMSWETSHPKMVEKRNKVRHQLLLLEHRIKGWTQLSHDFQQTLCAATSKLEGKRLKLLFRNEEGEAL